MEVWKFSVASLIGRLIVVVYSACVVQTMMESSPPNPKAIEEVFNNEETPDDVQEQDSHSD